MSAAEHDDVGQIEGTILSSVSCPISAAQKLRVRRVAELMALSNRMRGQALSGEIVDLGE